MTSHLSVIEATRVKDGDYYLTDYDRMPFDLWSSVKRKAEDECHYEQPKRLRISQEM
jgi:hypothetical protein